MRNLVILTCILLLGLTLPLFAGQLIAKGQTDLALKGEVTASTTAGSVDGKYGPDKITDNDPNTWWAAESARTPQWFDVKLPRPQKIDTVVLLETSNPALYSNWKHVIVSFSSGEPVEQDLPDGIGPHLIRFTARTASFVKVTITRVYDPKSTYLGAATLSVYYDPEKQVAVKVPFTEQWQHIDLTERGRRVHPCVYLTPADVQAARERVKTEPWAKTYADSVIAQAKAALAKPDAWYHKMMPKKGACFAYGFTGCPICNASWGTWGGANCSWDNPGHVTCANGHVLPDAAHPDPGTGYVSPDGRIHYFVGSWNAWVIEHFIFDDVSNLAQAYSLTGDEAYADKAAMILDAIANIYPSCNKGSWDYPSDPPSGRLDRPWYQVARVLVRLVDFYDQIYNSPSLNKPSITPGLTRRQNIETNMLKNGAAYCYQQSLHGGLNNGEADYIRGALSVGCLLGIDSYVRWAYDGPYGILALVHNNVSRDGRYFETSLMYAEHSRGLYLTFAEPLWNYRSPAYPHGIDIYDDPVFRSFYILPSLSISCLGHSPRYGDSAPDITRLLPPQTITSPLDDHFAEMLYARTKGPARQDFAHLLCFLSGGKVEKARAGIGDKEWMLFHAAPPPRVTPKLPAWLQRRITDTTFFGQKGIALLRTPYGRQAQAALIRFGPSLNHGHLDDLNLAYYALGYELTYDLGYSLGSTHTQVGWAHQTASHNLVMVDEKPQGPDSKEDGSGGSLNLLAALPGLQIADCSAEDTYRSLGVKQYRRLCALVGDGPGSYLLDVFHVVGGHQHDYIMHALSNDATFSGVKLGPPAQGSLAGPDIAWGSKQGNDGDIIGFPNKPYWNPPPGNGFGFLMAPQRGAVKGQASVTWNIGRDDCHLKMTLLAEPGTDLISAWAPGIYPQRQGAYGAPAGYPRSRYVLAERKGAGPLTSTYTAILQPYSRPLPTGVHDESELAGVATATGGEVRDISSLGVLFFKATSAQDEMRLALSVPRDGRYAINVKAYGSAGYGAARMWLDGQPLDGLINGDNALAAGAPRVFHLGVRELTAGQHKFALRVVRPQGENYWMGLEYIALTPVADEAATEQPARPPLTRIDKLASPPGTVAVQAERAAGGVDYLLYNPTPGRSVAYGQGKETLRTDAFFARVSTAQGKITHVNLVGGSQLAMNGLQLELPQGSFSGKLTRVDYQANKLYTNVKLPTDGRLNGLPIYLDNPAYSRDTVYRIGSVEAVGEGSVIDLAGPTSMILGFADLDDNPTNDHLLTTLNPHEYSRALGRPDSRFFHGKLLATADGKLHTTIRATWFAQPFRITVDSTKGFRKGQRVYYYDVQAGDDFTIYNTCSLAPQADGALRLLSTADVTVTAPGGVSMVKGAVLQKVPQGKIAWRAKGSVLKLSGS